MDDLISRKAAITLPVIPKKYREYQTSNLDDAYEQGWNDLQKCIESLPSAQQWIPCSDRLPKEEGEYLVTFNDKWYGPKVRILWYGTPFDIILDQDKWVFYCDQDYGFETFAPGKPVVAWMRMPDPYNDGHE